MHNIPNKSKVYLDTWLLLRILIKNFDEENKEKAEQLFTDLIIKECEVTTSPLAFVEMIKVMNDNLRSSKKVNKVKTRINVLFKKWHFCISLNLSEGVRYTEMKTEIADLKRKIKKLEDSNMLKISTIETPSDIVLQMLENLERGDIVKPADSMHYSYALGSNCEYIISGDKKFIKKINQSDSIKGINYLDI